MIDVTERDFRIEAPRSLPAGRITLVVRNAGPDNHELIVVPANRGPLPLRADGLTVDEKRLEPLIAGSLDPGKPRAVRKLELDLEPGRYVLFCNMSGHFLGGMRRELLVR